MTITVAAALIGLATAFGPAGTAPAASLPDGTPVIEVGGRHFGGQRSGHRGGGRDFGRRGGGGRDFGRRGGHRSGHRGGGRDFGHRGYAHGYGHGGHGHGGHGHGHGHGHGPYILGGVALGTFLFLNALEDY